MFDSSTDLAASSPPRPLGKDRLALATEEHGRPVPYLAGRRRLGLTWISDAWGVRSTPVRRKVGKEKKTTGYNYHASFAGVLCLGPVQALHAIHVEEDRVWEGPLEAGTDDHADITVEGRGPLRLYWGTATQDPDPTLAASGLDHPAYRGQCYVVFDDWLLGENRSQVPQIEFEITRLPQGSGLSVPAGLNGEVNPVAALEEVLRAPRFGAGITPALIDYPSWNDTAQALADEGFSLSVLLDQPTKLDAFVSQVLEYLDAALVQTATGALALHLLRRSVAPVVLGTADLTEPPDLTAHGWPEVANEIIVRFPNRHRAWQGDSVSFRDLAGYTVSRRPVTRAIECDWITDPAVAWRVAAGKALSEGLPWLDGTLRVRRAAAAALRPGDTAQLTYATQGLEGVLFRVLAVELPGPESGEVRLTVREDTSHLLASDYAVPADGATDATSYEPEPCHDVLVFEVPRGWVGTDKPHLVVLPVRGDSLSNRYTVWWKTGDASFDIAAQNDVFGRRGTLNAPLDANGAEYAEGALDVSLTGPDTDLDALTYAEGADAQRFLVFLGQEVLYGWDPVLVAPGRYTVNVLRGRKGSVKRGHEVGEACWLVQVPVDAALTLIPFSTRWKVSDTTAFKVQTHLLQRELDLADAPEVTHTFTRRGTRPLGPENLTANGDGVAPTYGTGQNVVLSWTLTSEDREEADPTVDVASRAEKAVIELWQGGALQATIQAEEHPPFTLTHAGIVAALGAELTFTVRLYLARGAYRSQDYDEITVTKA